MALPIVAKLKKNIADLEYELKHVLPGQLEEARLHGDLSENAEWEAAKERKAFVESRLSTLQQRVRELSMYTVSSIPHGVAGYGSRVTVEDADSGEEITYRLAFPEEADAASGSISMTSPLGQALMNRAPGAEVEVVTPKGKRFFEIVDLVTIHDDAEAAKESAAGEKG